ncbi:MULTISPECIES: hypothetical protein [Bacteria]|uniref:hypothetical protein n=1 Tax=Bacteria TaxID=2 RepID=UPI003C7EB31D
MTREENTRVYRPRPASVHTALADRSFQMFDDEHSGALPGPKRGRKGSPPLVAPLDQRGDLSAAHAIGNDPAALAAIESR